MPYSSYDHDKLETAETMRIERRIYFEAKDGDIAPYVSLPLEQLHAMREESAAAEQAILTISQPAPPLGNSRREKRFCLTKRLNTQGQPLCSTLLTSGRKANMTDIPAATGYIR